VEEGAASLHAEHLGAPDLNSAPTTPDIAPGASRAVQGTVASVVRRNLIVSEEAIIRLLRRKGVQVNGHCTSCHNDADDGYAMCVLLLSRGREASVCCVVSIAWDSAKGAGDARRYAVASGGWFGV
jgi:cytochrome c